MDDDEPFLLEPNSSYVFLAQGTGMSLSLFQNGEKIENFKLKKDKSGQEYAQINFKTPSSSTIINNHKHNHKHLNFSLAGFSSIFSE